MAPRLVKPDETEPPENERARILLEQILEKRPCNLAFLYEADGVITYQSLSGSITAARGLVDEIYELLHPIPE